VEIAQLAGVAEQQVHRIHKEKENHMEAFVMLAFGTVQQHQERRQCGLF